MTPSILPVRFRSATQWLAAGVLCLGTSVSQAALLDDFQFNQPFNGTVQFKIDAVTRECDSTSQTCFGGNVANPNLPVGGPANQTFNETTWGIGRITQILGQNPAVGNLWQEGQDGQAYISLFIYGIADLRYNPQNPAPNDARTIFNVGCQGGTDCDGKIHMDGYLVNSQLVFANTPSANRTGFNTFTGVTDGELLFRWVFEPGVNSTEPTATLTQFFDPASQTGNLGNGNFLASCVAGPLCTWPGVNGVYWNNGGFPLSDPQRPYDAVGTFTTAFADTGEQSQGWALKVNDPVQTNNKVPAPGALLLLVPGLLGLVWRRRRELGA